jgi:gamma-glutamyl phosphate reductase
MTTIINPNEAIPDELSQALSDSGFTSEDVQAVLNDIREANGHLMKQTKTVSTPAPQPSIEL